MGCVENEGHAENLVDTPTEWLQSHWRRWADPETTGWGGRQDGLRLFISFLGNKETGKSVRLEVLGTWMIGDGEIETGEK